MRITSLMMNLLDWINPLDYECNNVVTRILHILFFAPACLLWLGIACLMMVVCCLEALIVYVFTGDIDY